MKRKKCRPEHPPNAGGTGKDDRTIVDSKTCTMEWSIRLMKDNCNINYLVRGCGCDTQEDTVEPVKTLPSHFIMAYWWRKSQENWQGTDETRRQNRNKIPTKGIIIINCQGVAR